MKLNVLTGLPRSGSTLFCNILNQNLKFQASSTSELPRFLNEITHSWSNSIDIKNELNLDRKKTEEKMLRTQRAYVEAWYDTDKIVFDKSRGWSNNILMLQKLYPESKTIVLVRDLKEVFASIEKQHQKFPLLDEAKTPQEKTIYTRADQMFSPEGIIGSCVIGIEDIIRRKLNVMFLKYEDFTENPKDVMKEVYKFLKEKHFEHNFKDVKNTAIDPDGFYLYKYPHKGDGEIRKSKSQWKEYISDDLANIIDDKFKDYNKIFGYGTNNK